MNKKGNVYASIMVALIIIIVGFTIANFLKSPIDDARIGLNCDNASAISDGTKVMCLVVDSSMIYFIILLLGIAGGVITEKFLI